jgi:Uma2 family endonuclease
MYQPISPRSPLETMPTMYDLPSELIGESGLPDEFHCIQATLLTETCQPANYPPEEMLLASDLNLYIKSIHL